MIASINPAPYPLVAVTAHKPLQATVLPVVLAAPWHNCWAFFESLQQNLTFSGKLLVSRSSVLWLNELTLLAVLTGLSAELIRTPMFFLVLKLS